MGAEIPMGKPSALPALGESPDMPGLSPAPFSQLWWGRTRADSCTDPTTSSYTGRDLDWGSLLRACRGNDEDEAGLHIPADAGGPEPGLGLCPHWSGDRS